MRAQHSSGTPQPLNARVFARGLALRARNTAWLVGAGTSAEAGVPTAGHLIDHLLVELYASDSGLPTDQVVGRPRWQDSVYPLYDGQGGLPPISDDAFYSAIFERVFPDRDARARFVMEVLAGRQPHHGQHILAGLAASSLAPLLVTTNFDQLLEEAIGGMLSTVGAQARLTVLDPQNARRADFAIATDQRPMLVKIHGDLGSVTLSNTEAELAQHDPKLRAAVLAQLSRYGLVVVGYSGRDAAVMRMLRDVLDQPNPYPAGLTWVRRPEDPLAEPVVRLLDTAREVGVEPVHEVVVGGFGEFMTEIGRACRLIEPVRRRLADLAPAPVRVPAGRPGGTIQEYPQVRFGAVEVTALPQRARKLKVSGSTSLPAIRAALRAANVRATVGWAGGEYAAFGQDEDLLRALAPIGVAVTSEDIALRPVRDGVVDSGTVGLLAEALVQGLARTPGLTTVLRGGQRPMLRVRTPRPGERELQNLPPGIQALGKAVDGQVAGALAGPQGARLPWAEAVSIGLEFVDHRWLMLFAPDIWVRPTFIVDQGLPPGRDEATRQGSEFVRQRVATRYNKRTGAILGTWLHLLVAGGRTIRAVKVGDGDGVDATFTLRGKPVVSRPLAGGPIQITSRQVR